MEKKWQLKKPPPVEFQNRFPELHPIALRLLWNRNIKTQEEIDEFLNPDYSRDLHDPFLFSDMRRAANRIFEAIARNEKIFIYGDYDADGVCAAAILTIILRAIGAAPEVYIPHRDKEGYGLNNKAVEYLAEKGAKVILTCDCGISNKAEIDLAAQKGIDVIITDHHTLPLELPKQAFAIIHPKLNEKYPFTELSGGGVAFKFAQGLLKLLNIKPELSVVSLKKETLNLDHEAAEKWLLDLAAISSVADMMPLRGETRTLVKYGLIVLNKTRRLGLQKLIEVAGLRQGGLDTHSIGFQIAPRLNAAGRMNHANSAYKLLLTNDEKEAQNLANQLNQNNSERQKQTDIILQEAKYQIIKGQSEKDACLFAFDKKWPLGLVGLVAGKIADEFNRPAILMTEMGGEIKSSGRSIDEFNLIEGLQKISEFFSRFGGHAGAAGFTLKDRNKLDDFKGSLLRVTEEALKGKDLSPKLQIDARVDIEHINWDFYEILQKLEPFGEENPKPRFWGQNLEVAGLQAVGNGGRHMRLVVKASLTGIMRKTIGFCFGHWCEALRLGDKIDIVFEVDANEWNGNKELQLKIIDLRPFAK